MTNTTSDISNVRPVSVATRAQSAVHHAPQRLVETASAAARAWNLLPDPADGVGQA